MLAGIVSSTPMKKLRVLLLVHESLVPPDDLYDYSDPRAYDYETEFDVKEALVELGHEVNVFGFFEDFEALHEEVKQWKPDIIFNLTEDFAGIGENDHYLVAYFEMMNLAYTGCNARGMVLARDKAVSKKILRYHDIKVPDFEVFPFGSMPKKIRPLPYPLIVKGLKEEGSVGIAQASYVENEKQLRKRVEAVHNITQDDVIAEQYIHGREFYVAVLGNERAQVLPIRELVFNKGNKDQPRMATYKVKWDHKYRERWGIDYVFARNMARGMKQKITRLCKDVYRILELSGYARIDLRLTPDNELYVLEANPNPGIADGEDVAFAAEKAGMDYEDMIERIVKLGLQAYKARQTE